MTDHTTAAQAAHTNPLSDEYVNAVIQQHGYQSPETVIARLNQWIGLHGGENGVTLLMYEAHKALVKLRAPVADERQGDIAAALQDSAYCAGLQRGFALGNHNDNDGLRQALESRDGYVKTIKEARAALASAPVAGEAVAWRVTHPRSPKPGWEDAAREQPPTLENVKQQDPDLVLELSYAAPQASEGVCSCPTGDGSLRHPCAVHPPQQADNDGDGRQREASDER